MKNFDVEGFLSGVFFVALGFLMLMYIRKKKPASEETNWKGQAPNQYIQFWAIAIFSLLFGIYFLLKLL